MAPSWEVFFRVSVQARGPGVVVGHAALVPEFELPEVLPRVDGLRHCEKDWLVPEVVVQVQSLDAQVQGKLQARGKCATREIKTKLE